MINNWAYQIYGNAGGTNHWNKYKINHSRICIESPRGKTVDAVFIPKWKITEPISEIVGYISNAT